MANLQTKFSSLPFVSTLAGSKYWTSIALCVLIVGSVMSAATNAQTPGPFFSAAEQARLAAQAKQLTAIHRHLQHVLNCLEGPTGQDYKQSVDNPCSGEGAFQTLPEHSANRVRAQKASALARLGVTLHDVPPAHYVALAIHAILTEEQKK
jgi:hypothetical protein